jgi:radical SAM-linked protein
MTRETGPGALLRVRLAYSRQDALRYTSHLDMHLVWERTLRRAGVPLAYSQGFNPKPRLHVAAALPLGFLSRGELADFWLEMEQPAEPLDLEELAAQIRSAAPPGLGIGQAWLVPLSAPALQTQVVSAEYTVLPLDPLDSRALGQAIADLLAAASLPRARRGKPYDLRTLVERLELEPGGDGRPAIHMRLAAHAGATGRPEEVLAALGLEAAGFRIERVSLILQESSLVPGG